MINTAWKFQKGVTLIELLVAVFLSLFVTGAMISLFVNSKENYRVTENMARLQENARFAVSFISRDIRMADYRTCLSADRLSDAIAGQNDTGLNGSDTVTINWQVDSEVPPDSDPCDEESRLIPPEIWETTYSIQTGSNGGPALFRSVNGAAAVELVEGIEDLQVFYGEDTDNDNVANYFVDATGITNMAQAISMRFTLTARTLETNITGTGERLTRDFTSTVTLRNRLP